MTAILSLLVVVLILLVAYTYSGLGQIAKKVKEMAWDAQEMRARIAELEETIKNKEKCSTM